MSKSNILSHAPAVIFLSTLLVVFVAWAWTEPTSPPPQNNVPAPLNISATGQAKAGGVILNTGGANTGLIVDKGDVGIGTQNPQAKLDVAGLLQVTGFKMSTEAGAGRVLTSDANGVGSWQATAGGGGAGGGAGSSRFGEWVIINAGNYNSTNYHDVVGSLHYNNSWEPLFKAKTDGFVLANCEGTNPGYMRGWTSNRNMTRMQFAGNNDRSYPDIKRFYAPASTGSMSSGISSLLMPVKNGDYWAITASCIQSSGSMAQANFYWLPLQ